MEHVTKGVGTCSGAAVEFSLNWHRSYFARIHCCNVLEKEQLVVTIPQSGSALSALVREISGPRSGRRLGQVDRVDLEVALFAHRLFWGIVKRGGPSKYSRVSKRTASCSGVHESRLTDLTLEMCAPSPRWIPAHRTQR